MVEPPPWIGVELPAEQAMPPHMLRPEEIQYLIWLGASASPDAGAVVDLGPWLGGSACALAEGLRRGGRPGVVQAFDNFVWRRHYMESRHPTGLAEHADFQPLFSRCIAPWADRIEAHRADLHAFRWEGGPIGVLMVDAAKSWELASAILASFGPALVPGRSLVVLQDYQHWSTPFLPLIIAGRPDLWEPVHLLTDATSASFRPRKPVVGPGGASLPYGAGSFSWPETVRIMDRLLDAHTGPVRVRLCSSYLRLAVLAGRSEEAAALRRAVLADAPPWLASQIDAITDTLYQDLQRAASLREAGAVEAALALARGCHERAPEEPWADVELIACLGAAGRDVEAMGEADALVRLAPDFGAGWLARAKLHAAAARRASGLEDAARALALDPSHAGARALVARLAPTEGDQAGPGAPGDGNAW